MKVQQLMTRDVRACKPGDSLGHAAQIMWETDCGCVPVVDDEGRAVAMLTDRDVAMAALTRGVTLHEMRVASASSSRLVVARPGDELATAEQLMREFQVRRLPVVGDDGRLLGVLSINDLVRRGQGKDGASAEGLVKTLAAVCTPPAPASAQQRKPV